jgi:TPR repeat protein
MKKFVHAFIAASILAASPVRSQDDSPDKWGVTASDWQTMEGGDFRRKIGVASRRSEIEAAAERGEIDAMVIAAGAFADTSWGPPDFAKSYRYAGIAAEAGSPRAMVNLGNLFLFGNGVSQDKPKAFSWFQKSAELGQVIGMRNAAAMLDVGNGVPINGTEAVAWYRLAAEAGDIPSQMRLGEILFSGREGIPMSRSEAQRQFSSVASNPKASPDLVARSLFNLGVIAELERQYQAARSYYLRARAAGYVDNQNALANLDARIAAEAEQARRDFFAFSGRTANGLLYVLSNAGLPANFDQRDVRVNAQCASWLNSTQDFAGQRMTGLAWLKLEKSSSTSEAEAAWSREMMKEPGMTRQRVEDIRNKMRRLSFLTLKSSGCVNLSYDSSFSVIVPDGQR